MYSYDEAVCLKFCIQSCSMKDRDEENQRENIGGDCDVSNRFGIAWARWAEAGIPES